MSTSLKHVDAHIHLSDPNYAEDIDEVIAEAKKANVVAMLSNSVDLQTSVKNIRLAEQHRGLVFAAVGVHPLNVQTISDGEIEEVVRLARKNRANRTLVAIGEVGLDSKYTHSLERQMEVFDTMLRLAEELNLPVCVHSRGATGRVVDLLPSYSVRCVLLHWFSSSPSVLSKALDSGYSVSEGPAVVYSKKIEGIVRKTPLDMLLTETDGPTCYHGAPFNGETATPATHIPTVTKRMAEIKESDELGIANHTLRNLTHLFARIGCQ